jgi:hypothetical protein
VGLKERLGRDCFFFFFVGLYLVFTSEFQQTFWAYGAIFLNQ